jgi:hypothetical protein
MLRVLRNVTEYCYEFYGVLRVLRSVTSVMESYTSVTYSVKEIY